MWPPSTRARSEAPASVNHWLPAASISSTAPVPSRAPRRNARASSHVAVQATRWAPVGVAGQLSQLLQIGDGAAGIERHGGEDTTVRGL